MQSHQILLSTSPVFDLQQRTQTFAEAVRRFVKFAPKSISSFDDYKQLVRSSGSIGANYIEAKAALSRKDFLYRIKICRKEAQETLYWLSLIQNQLKGEDQKRCDELLNEIQQLVSIFTASAKKIEASLPSASR